MQPVLSKEWDNDNETDTVRFINQRFNAYGKATFTSVPASSSAENYGSTTAYDGLQRVISQTNTANGDLSFSYDSNNSITVTNGKGYSTTTQYLAYGSPVTDLPKQISQPEGVTTSISYNEANLPEFITQGGMTEERRYDSAMRLCLQKRPETGSKVMAYNALGEVTAYAEGVSAGTGCPAPSAYPSALVTQTYDNLGDARTTTYPDGTASKTATLDPQGNLKALVNGSNSWSYQYNSLNLPYQQSLTLDSKTYTIDLVYNNHGYLQSKTYGGATLAYAPNALGLPTQVADSQTYASNVLYYPNGQLRSYSYGNGLTFSQTLDAQFKPYERQVKSGGTLRSAQRYRYDNNDNLDTITDLVQSNQSISMTFDGLDRLDTASGGWGSGSFDYDALSNLTVKQLGSQNLSYVYHPSTKRLSTVTGGYNFSYDDRGNVINNGKRAFQFNRANQMTSSGTISYQYDGHGRRVKKTGSSSGYSVYDLSGTLLLSDGPNGQTRYIHLGKELIAKTGSAAALEDKPGYTGHIEDKDLSLTYMQQRYYDPVIGRFYSNDPVGFTASNPMMFNRYAYANNNPYKFTDPDGRNPFNFSNESNFSNLAKESIQSFDSSFKGMQQDLTQSMPNDPAGVTLGAIGIAAGTALTPIGGAVVTALATDQLVSAWTGEKSLVETGITSAASALGANKGVSENIGKVGNLVVSLAAGGAKSMVDTVRQTGNIGDAAGTTSILKDTAKIVTPVEDENK